MESDRWSYLAVQAYKSGLLGFQRSDRTDERWRLKEEILLCEVERSIDATLHTLRHTAESTAAQHATAEIFNHYRDRAENEYLSIRNLMKPYAAKGATETPGDMSAVRQKWEDVFGSLDDPNTQAEIEKFVQSVEKDAEDARRSQEPEQKQPRREYPTW